MDRYNLTKGIVENLVNRVKSDNNQVRPVNQINQREVYIDDNFGCENTRILVVFTGSNFRLSESLRKLSRAKKHGFSYDIAFSFSGAHIMGESGIEDITRALNPGRVYTEEDQIIFDKVMKSVDGIIVPMATQDTTTKLALGIGFFLPDATPEGMRSVFTRVAGAEYLELGYGFVNILGVLSVAFAVALVLLAVTDLRVTARRLNGDPLTEDERLDRLEAQGEDDAAGPGAASPDGVRSWRPPCTLRGCGCGPTTPWLPSTPHSCGTSTPGRRCSATSGTAPSASPP